MIAGLAPLSLNLEKLYTKAAIRNQILHPHNGVKFLGFPPYELMDPTGLRLIAKRGQIIPIPPLNTPRQSKSVTALASLEKLAVPLLEDSPHDIVNRPGFRALDVHSARIKLIVYPPKLDDIQQWSDSVTTQIQGLIANTPTVYVLASNPGHLALRTGAYAFTITQPGLPDVSESDDKHVSNHHELSLWGLVSSLSAVIREGIVGPINILCRNQAAVSTILDVSSKHNRHYARSFNRLLSQWLEGSFLNSLTIGWLPKSFPHPVPVLAQRKAKATRKPRDRDPTFKSAATLLYIAKRDMNIDWNNTANNPKYCGRSFPRFRGRTGPIKHNNGNKMIYIDACDDRTTLLARFTRMATNHAPIGSYYRRFPHHNRDHHCSCPQGPIQSRTHILDECSMYNRPWESWLHETWRTEGFLYTIVTFLKENPHAFSFT
jgi:hypothetical protein